MKLKDGMEALPTVSGLIFTIILTSAMILFTTQKFLILVEKKDAKIFSTVLFDSIPAEEVFDTKMGLKFAVALTRWGEEDAVPEPLLDESIGRIAFYRGNYGYNENKTFYHYDELPSHYCTKEELNLEKSTETKENVFYPIASRSEQAMNVHYRRFLCLDQDDMRLHGDYSSDSASLLFVKLEKCHGHDYCKSEEELKEFFNPNMYFILLNNQVRFDTVKHSEDSIVRESVIEWMRIDPEGLFTQQYQLRTGKINLQDLLIDMDDLTEFVTDVFSIQKFNF